VSLSFKSSGYFVLGQVVAILALNLPTDFHICYPSTHTDVEPLTPIYSPVHPHVGISTCCSTNRFPNTGTLINICILWILATSWEKRNFTSIAHVSLLSDSASTWHICSRGSLTSIRVFVINTWDCVSVSEQEKGVPAVGPSAQQGQPTVILSGSQGLAVFW